MTETRRGAGEEPGGLDALELSGELAADWYKLAFRLNPFAVE